MTTDTTGSTETSGTPSATTDAPTPPPSAGPPAYAATPPAYAATPPSYAGPRRLLRRRDRVFGGVASGIADYTGLPTLLVRLLFVASAFMGWGLLLYPVLWVVVPDEHSTRGA